MKTLISTLLLLVSIGLSAQDRYQAGMQKAMDHWSSQEIPEALNLFERISEAEPDQWIPPYYVALLNALSAFGEKDEAVLSQKLEKASTFIERSEGVSPNNAEILVVKALINTAWIAFDGSRYGMTLSPVNAQLYQEALALAPDNPRVVFSKADWDMGSARYFGKDTSVYCERVLHSLKLFGDFSSDVPFYPNWGEARARQVASKCEAAEE